MSKRKLANLVYRIRVRKELGNLDNELLDITLEEAKKEKERRNRKK